MQLDNHTPWQADLIPGWAFEGQWQQTAVVKIGYQFELDGSLSPLPESAPLNYSDVFADDPESSSLDLCTDTVPFKSGFEILIQGMMYPKPHICAQRLQAKLQQRDKTIWQKTVNIFGPRQWQSSIWGTAPGKPAPIGQFEPRWEHAYGGNHPEKEERFDSNPVGVCWHKLPKSQLLQHPLPQQEGEPLLLKPGQKRSPAGFGPVASHWSPRVEAFSALDADKAVAGLCPYTQSTPQNLYNYAPADQQLKQPPETDSRLHLQGWYAEAPELVLPLPAPAPQLWRLSEGKKPELLTLTWDTLMVNTSDRQLHLLFRAGIGDDLYNPDTARIMLIDPQSPEGDDATV
ncbi:DUF2169 family type VI secretion system accessory protein [Gynuella sunshinyii]|uniref:DUF2169 domain-containing protein n=1 Tax=Gynuella sunshinyii YC6258 TaxID=1445510 RepID=A0A0C5VTH3_9GAMM|nr:DUF2169 domain-containing protein [Gynuella sunshinyii]AJQ97987.1 hypothetical protein YC6258_05963 [Gynuella sunshinyii YC6258]